MNGTDPAFSAELYGLGVIGVTFRALSGHLWSLLLVWLKVIKEWGIQST